MSAERPWSERGKRRIRIALIYAVLVAPVIFYGALVALSSNANSPLDWVDSGFLPRQHYDHFSSQFGQGDLLIVSWPGCTVHQERLDQFADRLRTAPGFYEEEKWMLADVFTGRELFKRFTNPPFVFTEIQALERMEGWLVGADHKSTCAVIAFNPKGLNKRSAIVPLIHRLASEYGQVAPDEVHFAGPVADGYSVDMASRKTMDRFAPISAMVVYLMCLLSIRSFINATIVFLCAVISQGLALAIMHYTGGTTTALTIVLPPLIQVLSIAGGVHLSNYAVENLKKSPLEQDSLAIDRAVRLGWLPCVLSSVTTAIGMASLAASGIVAVREFGIFAAIGVLSSTACLLLIVPGGMYLFPPQSDSRDRQLKSSCTVDTLMRVLSRYYARIITGGLAITGIFACGLPRLQASVSIETLFGAKSRLILDYMWLEEHVAPLVPIETIVDFSDCHISVREQLECLRRIELTLAVQPQIISVTSPLDLLPSISELEGQSGELRYVEASLFDLAKSMNYASGDSKAPRWRITARVSALGGLKYDKVLKVIRSQVSNVVDSRSQWNSSQIDFTGLMPLVHEIQKQLFLDLFLSFVTAFVIIAVVMSIVQAGLVASLVTMIPNVFPSVLMFGFLGWLGKPIDIGSMMTASIAMGIAVDDTLHFINYFQHKMREGLSVSDSVSESLRNCGMAMIQTTVICSAGLTVFALSDFAPTANFAWMMVSLLLIALAGDLILLPSILLSPLGKSLWIMTRENVDGAGNCDSNDGLDLIQSRQ